MVSKKTISAKSRKPRPLGRKRALPKLNFSKSEVECEMATNSKKALQRSQSVSSDLTISSNEVINNSKVKHFRSIKEKHRKITESYDKQLNTALAVNNTQAEQIKTMSDEIESLKRHLSANFNKLDDVDFGDMETDGDISLSELRNNLKRSRKDTDSLCLQAFSSNGARQILDDADKIEPCVQDSSSINRDFPALPTKLPSLANSHNQFKRSIISPATRNTFTTTATVHQSSSAQPKAGTSTSAKTLKSSDSSAPTNNALPNLRTPPPIVAYDIDTKKVFAEFKKLLGHSNFDIDTKNSRCSHIRTRNRKDYDGVVEAIANMQLEHHRYTPYEDRIINVLLHRMCPTFDKEDIKEGIENLNLNIQIHSIQKHETERSIREQRDLNMWLIQLKPGSNVVELLQQRRFLCQSNIFFERRKQSGVIQCKNCQHFGHTARNCSRRFRCVKCIEEHCPGECPNDIVPREDVNRKKPTCVNCGKDHPASYRGCKTHVELIKLKQERAKELKEQQFFKQQSFNSYRTTEENFADVLRRSKGNSVLRPSNTRNNRPTTAQGPTDNCFSFLQRECSTVFGMDFFTIQRNIREFAPKYKLLQGIEKQEALIKFILTITPDF